MSYINPLHPPVPSNIHSSYTSLAGAYSAYQPPFAQALPSNLRRLPQAPKSKQPSSRSATCPAVTFDLQHYANGLGVPMCELRARSAFALEQILVGANDVVGPQMRYRTVQLKICWPGYDDYTCSLDIYTSAGPITRGKLAIQVAEAFVRFSNDMTTTRPGPNGASWPLRDSSNHLSLSALWNLYDDVWMAEVNVDRLH